MDSKDCEFYSSLIEDNEFNIDKVLDIKYGTWKGIELENLSDIYLKNIINFLKRNFIKVPYILRLELRIRKIEINNNEFEIF